MNTLTSSLQVRTFPPLLLSSPLCLCQSLRLNPLHPRPWLRAMLLASRWRLCRSRPFTRCTSSSCTLCSCRLRGWRGILLDAFLFLSLPRKPYLVFFAFFSVICLLQLYTYSPIQAYHIPFNLLFTFDKKTTPPICAGLLTFLLPTSYNALFFAFDCVLCRTLFCCTYWFFFSISRLLRSLES